MPDPHFIIVGNYTSLPEAEIAQGILDNAGIESVLLDDNMGRMLSWIAIGGFRLQVNPEDADAASNLLDAPRDSQPATSSQQPSRCPNCDSSDIVLQESDTAHTGNPSLSLLAPVESRKYWECKSCGYCWDTPAAPDA